MKPQNITVIVIIATIFILIGYDIWAYLAGGSSATISQIILNASKVRPVWAFLSGFLAGHLFASQKDA